jgi:hypothetical protein
MILFISRYNGDMVNGEEHGNGTLTMPNGNK